MNTKLIVFQGPSASGKTTLERLLGLPKIITCTSREPRVNEANGKDYYFKTKKEMKEMLKNKELLEMTEYKDNYYGTPLSSISEIIANKNDSFVPHSIVVDENGAKMIKETMKNSVLFIGVSAPYNDCIHRLEERGSSNEEIQKRLKTFEKETKALKDCDIIINNSLKNQQRSKELIKKMRTFLYFKYILK